MKPEWKEFLTNRGAEWNEEVVESFGNPERERRVCVAGDVIADLSWYGLIEVHGADAETFMQGQFTNDVREVSEARSQLSGICSPKGRLLANFRIFRRGETWYLRLPHELVDPTLKRLRMFVLMSKVTLEDASDAFVRIGLSGPKAEEELARAGLPEPVGVDDVITTDQVTVVRVAGLHPRFEIYGELEPMKRHWEALDVYCAPVGTPAWKLLEIFAGLPTIYPETVEAFVPQMVNYPQVGGVSFRKGCYTGQEVVARMQYLGKLKRRMYRAHVDAERAPRPNDPLVAPGSGSGQGAGRIVDAQPGPDGGYEVLAVVEIASRERGEVFLWEENGPRLQFLELPYPAPETEQREETAGGS